MQSNQVKSATVTIKPQDSRCRYWAKIIRADQALPLPQQVDGANDVPGQYARPGEDELVPGDVMISGEENHHRHNRGWTYVVKTADADGNLVRFWPNSEIKATLKAAGMPVDLLKGSGDIAACIRIAHGLRMGLLTAQEVAAA